MSKLFVYKTDLSPQKNAAIDDINDYLATQTTTYHSADFQHIKLGLDITVKINFTQVGLSVPSLGNYCKIYQDGKDWFYFLIGVKWTAKNTLALQLSLDSINTFKNDLVWSDKTTIAREHRDRFYPAQGTSSTYLRRIEKESEGLSLSGELASSVNLKPSSALDMDFYLMYRTSKELSEGNLSNPISCYLFGSKPMTIQKSAGDTVSFAASDFPNGVYFYFTELDNPTGSYTVSGQNTVTWNNSKRKMLCLRNNNGQLQYQETESKPAGEYEIVSWDASVGTANLYEAKSFSTTHLKDVTAGTKAAAEKGALPWTNCNSVVFKQGNFFRSSSADYLNLGPYAVVAEVTSKMNIGAGSDLVLNTIDDIDRTDSRIMKIIKLPYAPTTIIFNSTNATYTFDDNWQYDSGLMRLKDGKLFTQFESTVQNVEIPELFVDITAADKSPTRARNDYFESKLYHSDFYTFKFVYDSFIKQLPLERINLKNRNTGMVWTKNNTKLPIKFKPTNTMNSKFAFKLQTSDWEQFAEYDATEDYENFLMVSRNNEETIFNNDYVNYIRNGYNYDQKMRAEQIKANNRNTWAQVATTALQLGVGTLAFGNYQKVGNINEFTQGTLYSSLAHSRADKDYKFGIGFKESGNQFSTAAGISAGANIITTLANNAQYKRTSEMQLEQKKAQLAAQSSSVAGSDDMDLLSYYNGNRLQVKKYHWTDQDRAIIGDLFYYTGYKYTAQELPNFTSRYWFNFVQCQPVFKDELTSPYADFLDDIKVRYAAGVTTYHKHVINGTNTWDLNQEKENWETFILEA